ncbi:MAG: lactonase family protein [Chitinophagaceae bacterium]
MKLKYGLLVCFFLVNVIAEAQEVNLFIGTYTGTGSKGIYVYKFNTQTGKATWVSNTDSMVNPSFLTVSSNGKFLYSVSESGGNFPGKINAFSFDKKTGLLKFINEQTSGGDNPCYVSVTKNGQWVAVGNYTGGNLSMFKTKANGALMPAAQFIQHEGIGPNKTRQEKAHVHSTIFSPDEKFLFVPDLGMDKVMTYKFKATSDIPLEPAAPEFTATAPGTGPRHLVFHPKKPFAYLVEEMAGQVEVFQYSKGILTPIQQAPTHPERFKGQPGSADIHISPDGKFLYASNRGEENNIAIFVINEATGMLEPKGFQSTLGTTPRNFCIDPTGNFLLAANQGSGNIVIFKRDQETGMLTPTGDEIKIPKPVCLIMKQ